MYTSSSLHSSFSSTCHQGSHLWLYKINIHTTLKARIFQKTHVKCSYFRKKYKVEKQKSCPTQRIGKVKTIVVISSKILSNMVHSSSSWQLKPPGVGTIFPIVREHLKWLKIGYFIQLWFEGRKKVFQRNSLNYHWVHQFFKNVWDIKAVFSISSISSHLLLKALLFFVPITPQVVFLLSCNHSENTMALTMHLLLIS